LIHFDSREKGEQRMALAVAGLVRWCAPAPKISVRWRTQNMAEPQCRQEKGRDSIARKGQPDDVTPYMAL
jgi:hypothetical protein